MSETTAAEPESFFAAWSRVIKAMPLNGSRRVNDEELAQRIARAWDPVGWAWYDRAGADHTAKPIFFADQMRRAAAVMKEIEL